MDRKTAEKFIRASNDRLKMLKAFPADETKRADWLAEGVTLDEITVEHPDLALVCHELRGLWEEYIALVDEGIA